MANEIYISTDIESDGPIPGPYSMLSFGSAAFVPFEAGDGWNMIGTFEANLETLGGAQGHPDTMDWWGFPARGLGSAQAGSQEA